MTHSGFRLELRLNGEIAPMLAVLLPPRIVACRRCLNPSGLAFASGSGGSAVRFRIVTAFSMEPRFDLSAPMSGTYFL